MKNLQITILNQITKSKIKVILILTTLGVVLLNPSNKLSAQDNENSNSNSANSGFKKNQLEGIDLTDNFIIKNQTNAFKIGVTIETYVSGNWHGTLYSPNITVVNKKNSLFAGPVIQKRSMLVQGLKIGYSRALTGGDSDEFDFTGDRVNGRIQLNVFAFAQYLNQLPLSYSAVKLEEIKHKQSDFAWNKLRLTTAELCVGIELHFKITKNISWKNFVGTSTYYHLSYVKGMVHEKVAPVLLLGTGICVKHF